MKTNVRGLYLSSMIGLMVACTAHVQANGFRNPPPGASNLGRDGGRTAWLDDATAVSENPANLVGQSPTVLGAVTMVFPSAEFTSALGKADLDDSVILLPNLYGLWGAEGSALTFGLGLTTPYGQTTEWERTAPFRYSAPYFAEMTMLDLSPVVAGTWSEVVQWGVGLDVYLSDLELRQALPWSMVLGAPGLPDGQVTLDGDGTGIGAHAGLTFLLGDRQRLSAVYRSQFDVDYDGDTTMSGAPPGVPVTNSGFETTMKFPNWITLAYGIELNEAWQVGVDVEWIQFSRYDSMNLNLGANNASGLFPSSIPQNWEDIWTFGAGAAYRLTEQDRLLGSYKFLESPIPDSTASPAIVDADKHAFSLGWVRQAGAHHFGLAYEINLLDDRTVEGRTDPTLNGAYEAMSHIVALHYGYRF